MILTASFTGTPSNLSLAHYRSVVAAAERVGLDAALFVRGAAMLDAVPLIAALASLPIRIGLGAGIPVDYTEPFHLARAFAAIDRLTRGRSAVVFDIAAGIDLAAAIGRSMPDVNRVARILEFFETTTKLWDSWEDDAILVDRPAGLFTDANKIHRINHDGAHYAVRGPLNAPRPIQGWPVIFVPVTSEESRTIAVRVADVVLVPGVSPDVLRKASATVCEHRDTIRVLADVEPILGVMMADAGVDESARFTGSPEQFAALMRAWHAAGVCDGFNLRLSPVPAEIEILADCIAALGRPRVADGITLRDRLDLPRPRSRYAP
jgi:alkanesulfonate monooxygenase SsuD/methylene tetrahydromethanopterin reductase-like flavin-dependent oxidoreductase (luciferase family)